MPRDPTAIPIYENYGAYQPSVDAKKIVSELLTTVPQKYLRGLGSVVLSSQGGLSRDQRRRKSWSRGRKISRKQMFGYYQPAWREQQAYIELYVDKICSQLPSPYNRFSVFRDLVLGEVLFHEVGHHIHYSHRPEFKEKEDVADKWAKTLLRNAVQQRYWYSFLLLPLARTVSFCYRKWKRAEPKEQNKGKS